MISECNDNMLHRRLCNMLIIIDFKESRDLYDIKKNQKTVMKKTNITNEML